MRDAAAAMKAPGYLVQQMVSSVAELLVGARVDPHFGPLIVVGAGGVNVELYKDVAVRLSQRHLEDVARNQFLDRCRAEGKACARAGGGRF